VANRAALLHEFESGIDLTLGVMQTGIRTHDDLQSLGRRVRRPWRAIEASCVPQMCMKERSRSTSSSSFREISCPRAIPVYLVDDFR